VGLERTYDALFVYVSLPPSSPTTVLDKKPVCGGEGTEGKETQKKTIELNSNIDKTCSC
jgi:hypothetical protein